MNDFGILSNYGLYAGTYIFCVISGLVPVVNAELFLILISSTVTNSTFLPIVLLASFGQMTAKVILFLSGKGILKVSLKKYENKLQETMLKMQKWESKVDVFIFLSAFTGFPPLYLVTIAAGMTQHNFLRFFISGFLGRVLRFGLVMLFPQFFKRLAQ